ncbi:hypothetical protein M514_19238 [Trichuris suis]|uniref:DUF7041 domain-containing protein n=1 Tax=Trichuris suis TaxID=68888 RepID=A0A085NGK9_9BILA|nr:hypothetical protein M514_19238 [Trichuris suis]
MAKKGNCSPPSIAPTAGPGTPQPSVPTPLAVPTFLSADPELWFARLDLFFRHRHVRDEETMFELALSAMTEETLRTLLEFILTVDQQTAPFTALRAVCLERLVEDRAQRIRQAMTDEELSGRPPSVFLRRLQQLMPAGSNEGSESVIRQLFVSRLPHQVQTALLPFEEKPLPELARIADRILALGESQLSASPVCATTHGVAARLDDLEERVRQLILHSNGAPRHLRSPDLTERCQQPRRSPSRGRPGRHVRRTYSPRGNSDIEQEAQCATTTAVLVGGPANAPHHATG